MQRGIDMYPLFLDHSRSFNVYLGSKNLDNILKRTRLVRRMKHQILPHVRLADIFLTIMLNHVQSVSGLRLMTRRPRRLDCVMKRTCI